MSRSRTSNRSTTAKTIEFPATKPTVLQRYPAAARPGNSHYTTTAPPQPQQQPEPQNTLPPDLTTGELSAILFKHLRADPATRDKALQILQTIEAEQQKKAEACICPTCRRPLGADAKHANKQGKDRRK